MNSDPRLWPSVSNSALTAEWQFHLAHKEPSLLIVCLEVKLLARNSPLQEDADFISSSWDIFSSFHSSGVPEEVEKDASLWTVSEKSSSCSSLLHLGFCTVQPNTECAVSQMHLHISDNLPSQSAGFMSFSDTCVARLKLEYESVNTSSGFH